MGEKLPYYITYNKGVSTMSHKVSITFSDEYYAEIEEYCVLMGRIPVQSFLRIAAQRYMNLYKKHKPADGDPHATDGE